MPEETGTKGEEPEWTAFELQLQSFRKSQCNENGRHELRDTIRHRMQESSLRDFLFHLNANQLQDVYVQRDKLDRLKFDIAAGLVDERLLSRRDDVSDDLLGLVESLLRGNPRGTVTVRSALKQMDALRLAGSEVQKIDNSLRRLEKLRCLILAGCCISQDFPGELLPNGLMMLEMYCNQLKRLDQFASTCPPNIVYLGLGRNYLTDDALIPLSKIEFLVHLDLSDNDIEDLAGLVSVCTQLKSLTSLELQGNPCSYAIEYPHIIAPSLPKLFFLDGEVLKKLHSEGIVKGTTSNFGSLKISLIRMMSFPQPKNEKIQKKKVTHTFRVEVLCPLLNKYISNNQETFEKLKTASIDKTNQVVGSKIKRGTSKTSQGREKRKSSKSRGRKSSNAGRDKKKANSGILQDSKRFSTDKAKTMGFDNDFDENLCFLSERKKWSKIIEFSEPTIQVSLCDLPSLRNVFRSTMVVYVTHLKTLPPVKGKEKIKKKKINNTKDSRENKDLDSNKEILVSKTVLAMLKIPLHSILWTEKTLDYSWSNLYPTRVAEECKPLKDLKYVIKKKKPPKKSKKGKAEESTELEIPKEFTVHIGVGVERVTGQA